MYVGPYVRMYVSSANAWETALQRYTILLSFAHRYHWHASKSDI